MPSRRRSIFPGAVGLVLLVACVGQNLYAEINANKLKARAARLNAPEPLPLPSLKKLTEVDKAYLDSYSILKKENSCSQFFGGPGVTEVLNEFTLQIRPTLLDPRVGVRMNGQTTLIQNHSTGFQYRLFEKAEVNLAGPFYRGNGLPGQPTVPQIGGFQPNTRETRVTILLHELGHLVRRPDGDWLLPNDGNSSEESLENTERVLAVCGEQIRELHKFSFEEELLTVKPQALNRSLPGTGPGR